MVRRFKSCSQHLFQIHGSLQVIIIEIRGYDFLHQLKINTQTPTRRGVESVINSTMQVMAELSSKRRTAIIRMISSTHMGKVEQGATKEVKCRVIGMLLSPPIHKVYPIITVKAPTGDSGSFIVHEAVSF